MSGESRVSMVPQVATGEAHAAEPVRHGVRKGDFRPDVEGMRAVAVLLVVVFHAGFTGLPGGFIGVDVFFVLSGFLITRLLIAEAHREGSIFLADFWARRARRLLPASTLTLVVVAAVSWLFVDPISQVQTGSDIVASAAFVANWWFAAQATDYFAADIDKSPLQHFWSLSVEEQYYVVWPPLLALVILVLVRRRGLVVGQSLQRAGLMLAAIGTASFALSVWLTANEPVTGYFSTLSRAWELAVGGLLAMALALGYRLRPRAAVVVGYAGLVVILVSAVLITEATPFPGFAALGPVLGTAAVLLAGAGGHEGWGVGRWLSVGPMQQIGRLSYSWYLWHWPFLILAAEILGPLDGVRTVLVVLASLLAAELTFRVVENPVRRSPMLSRHARNSLVLGALLIAVGLASGLLLGRHAVSQDSGIRPEPALAAKDLSQAHLDKCLTGFDGVSNRDCRYADVGAERTYVLLGDSHAVQWFPAAEQAARKAGAELVVFGKSSCIPIDTDLWSYRLDREYHECQQWRDDTLGRIAAMPKGTVILLSGWNDHYVAVDEDGRRMSATASAPLIQAGYARTVASLQEQGFTVVPIRDTPLPGGNPAKCVAADPDAVQECAFDRPAESAGVSWEESTLESAGIRAGVVDLNDVICDKDTCPAVEDGILRWRDTNHLSNTYAGLLGPALIDRLELVLTAASR